MESEIVTMRIRQILKESERKIIETIKDKASNFKNGC